MYSCYICNKSFKYQSKLIIHLNTKKLCNKKSKDYRCDFCQCLFPKKNLLYKHIQSLKHKNKIDYYKIQLNIKIQNLQIQYSKYIIKLNNYNSTPEIYDFYPLIINKYIAYNYLEIYIRDLKKWNKKLLSQIKQVKEIDSYMCENINLFDL